jgi:hypothetical protein
MISLRLAVPVVLVAAAVAGCFNYFATPPPPVEADQRLPPASPDMKGPGTGIPTNIDQRPSAEEQAVAAFQRSAAAILRQLPDAQASAGANEPPITGHIPLPKRRPIQAPDPPASASHRVERSAALGRSPLPSTCGCGTIRLGYGNHSDGDSREISCELPTSTDWC